MSIPRAKIVTLPKENLFAFANDKVSIKRVTPHRPKKQFVIGNRYSLKATECEGFTMRTNIYELVRIVEEVNGIEFKSLIMKPIDIGSSMIYSLTRQDCSNLGVEFQEGLQLFPMGLEWKLEDGEEVKEIDLDRDFDDNDLSTYPVNPYTLKVDHIIIRITGFTQISDSLLRTPTMNTMSINEFLKSLHITYQKTCEPFKDASEYSIKGRLVTSSLIEGIPHGIFDSMVVDNNTNSIFFELESIHRDMSNDEVYGLEPSFLQGKNINDLIHISWIETVTEDNSRDYEEFYRKMAELRYKQAAIKRARSMRPSSLSVENPMVYYKKTML